MDYLLEFNRIMKEQTIIALATCVKNIPNVRIVNFFYDVNKKGILFFSTFKNNQKVREFLENNTVSFTTIPSSGNEHVRVFNSIVKKSSLSIYDLKNEFIRKIPDYEYTINQVGDLLDLYEIYFPEAEVIIDFTNSSKIIL